MRACVLLRHTPSYRADVFAAGLRRHGYQIESKWQRSPKENDLLLLWNRCRGFEAVAQTYEMAGARVMIAENGYLDRSDDGQKFYALALGGHNGSGRWFVGSEPRFEIVDQPWREAGSKVLVLPQRGIGQKGIAMPTGWLKGVTERLRKITDRELVVRPHPGHQRIEKPLSFRDIWCVATWGSGGGIKALRAGIPVFHELPCWIGAAAAAPLADTVERCNIADRRILWTRVSWAQWLLEEIGSGEAFDRLLHEEDRGLFFAGKPPLAADWAGDGEGHRQRGPRVLPPVVGVP